MQIGSEIEKISGAWNALQVFEKIAKWAVFAVIFLLPVLFLPKGGIDSSREFIFGVLILLALGLWFAQWLFTGKVSYRKSLISFSVLGFVCIEALSTALSRIPCIGEAGITLTNCFPYFSFFSSDVTAEKFWSILLYACAYFLALSVLKDKKDPLIFMFLLVGGGMLASLVSLFAFGGLYIFPFDFAKRIDFNVVGTINGLAFLYGFLLLGITGFLFHMEKRRESMPTLLRVFLTSAIVLFFINLAIINFSSVWLGLFVAGVVLALIFVYQEGQSADFLQKPSFYLMLLIIVVPLLFLLFKPLLPVSTRLPVDISPSFQATVAIAKKVLAENTKNLLIGSGPGTFGFNYSLFKDPGINETVVWGIRFGQGYSYISTALATTGILGILSILALVGVSFFASARNILSRKPEHPLFLGFLGGVLFLFFAWFVYPANFTLSLVLFGSLGFLASMISLSEEGKEKTMEATAPWAVFGVSLFSIFCIALLFVGAYQSVNRFRASLYAEEAGNLAQQGGDVATIAAKLEQAIVLDPMNDRYYRFLAQAKLLRIQNIINEAFSKNPPTSIQNDFQTEVSAATNALQQSLQLNPIESFNWRTAGSVYELLIPFVQGADQSSITAYSRASELDPENPLTFVETGRALMTFADAAQIAISQPNTPADRAKQLSDARVNALQNASQQLEKATSLKKDLAPAHFLLAQIALRQGRLDSAIRSTESAQQSAPQDIGILFQLGLLYYQNKDLDKAGAAFSQAVVLNKDYSNARYFLGLILDSKGFHEEAIQNFEEIQKLNPDNQEVKKILENLRGGKPALTGIAPPPPEARKEAPVKETAGIEKTPLSR